MVVNIFDTANQLERDLRQTQEIADLKAAFQVIKDDEPTFKLFKEFQDLQVSLQQKQMQGQDPTEDEIQHAQDLANQVGGIDSIKALMEKEQAVDHLLNEINNLITKPIQELYQD